MKTILNFQFKNGKTESFCLKQSQNNMDDLSSVIYHSFSENKSGVLKFPIFSENKTEHRVVFIRLDEVQSVICDILEE